MTDLQAAAEKALEALEWSTAHRDDDNAKRHDAIEALRTALAQHEQAHTDHPMRHWDRTCPACVAEPWDTSDMAYRPNGLSVEERNK